VQPDLAFRALGYGLSGLLLLTMLVLTLVSMRKEARTDEPLEGVFTVTLLILSLCAFIALWSAYKTARSFQKLAPRMQTETVHVQ